MVHEIFRGKFGKRCYYFLGNITEGVAITALALYRCEESVFWDIIPCSLLKAS
jgi:hypothetical protein